MGAPNSQGIILSSSGNYKIISQKQPKTHVSIGQRGTIYRNAARCLQPTETAGLPNRTTSVRNSRFFAVLILGSARLVLVVRKKARREAGLSCLWGAGASGASRRALQGCRRTEDDEKANAFCALSPRKLMVPIDIAVLFFRSNLRFSVPAPWSLIPAPCSFDPPRLDELPVHVNGVVQMQQQTLAAVEEP